LHTEQSWLLSIVHRHAVDARRRHPGQLTPMQPPPTPIAEKSVEDSVERDRTRRVLAGLEAGEQQMLELAYFGGLSQSEIAAELAIPLQTVRSRMHHAVSRLRERLRERRFQGARSSNANLGGAQGRMKIEVRPAT
jgi:RNA polymerase sigma-70 factor (ECF subfamily)